MKISEIAISGTRKRPLRMRPLRRVQNDFTQSPLDEADDGKNKHLQHLEDEIIDKGVVGIKIAINALSSLYGMLRGHADRGYSITTKWDGCIHPDHILQTDHGNLRIEDIIDRANLGEQISVLSYDFSQHITVMSPITNAVKKTGNKKWIEIVLENDDCIRLTEDHEVYTTNRGWIEARNLDENDDIKEL